MSGIVGIDLGTTNSAVAVMEGEKPTIIPNADGERLTPSVVAFDPSTHQLLVGTPAKRQAVTNPQNTVFSIKRFVGRRSDDPTIQHDMKLAPYKTRAASNGGISVWMAERWCFPQEILAMILQKLKRDAEVYLGGAVTQAVITVPAYFNDSQRQATKDAGLIAGLEVLRIVNESTAACLAYGLHEETDRTVAVYHLGGGTFDISILDVGDGVFEVRSTSGDTHLGGDDWDQRIIDYVADEFWINQRIELRKDSQALLRLKEACERAKVELSTVMETAINLPFIAFDASGPKSLQMKLTRVKLEQLTDDLIEHTLEPCKRALADAWLSPRARRKFVQNTTDQALADYRLMLSKIDEVILVGQQTRMPAVREAVGKFFGKDPRRGVDPAEVVALGAAVQAGVLAGEVRDVLLLDLTPFTLSVETSGGVATPLIDRNTTIPIFHRQIFSTATDGQTSVDIRVYQGERPMVADNVLLGQLRLDGIPSAPRGAPQIEVTFDIDVNGILNVSAQDKATGREQKVTIIARGGGLAPVDFGRGPFITRDRPTATAKAPAPPRGPTPEDIQTRPSAEDLIRRAELVSSEQGDDLPVPVRHVVDSKVSALRATLQSGNASEIRYRTKELDKALQCVEALGKPDQGRAVELCAELFAGEKDKRVREYIWQTLVQIGGPTVSAEEALRRYRQVDDSAALMAKKAKAGGIKQGAWIRQLQARDWLKRKKAAQKLGDHGDRRAVGPLVDRLNDQNWPVQTAAAEALGKIGDPRAVESLVAALKSENQYLRRQAAVALGRIGDSGAIQPLTEALRHQDHAVRLAVVQALARFAIEPLVAALQDTGIDMQQNVPYQLPPEALWAWLLGELNDAPAA